MDDERKKILYENTTNFSAREITDYNKFTICPTFIKINILLPLLFVSFAVYMFAIGQVVVFWVSLAVGIIVACLIPFVYKQVVKSATKDNKLISSNTFVDYKFEEEGVRTTTRKGTVIIATFAIDYRMINKAVENKNYIYFFVSGGNAYVLDKNGMTYGKLEDFVNFLKSRGFVYKENKIKK
ncbi:MAG: YcxB family protein [Christensenellales bacterium]